MRRAAFGLGGADSKGWREAKATGEEASQEADRVCAEVNKVPLVDLWKDPIGQQRIRFKCFPASYFGVAPSPEPIRADTVSCPDCPEWTCEVTYVQTERGEMPGTLKAIPQSRIPDCAWAKPLKAGQRFAALDAKTMAEQMCCGIRPVCAE